MSSRLSRVSGSRAAVASLSSLEAVGGERFEFSGPLRRFVWQRCFDIVFATIILLLATPLLLMTAILVKLDSPGPAFIRQRRYGFRRRQFCIIKLRTMRVVEDGHQIVQCQVDDPRVTTIGKFLRRSSIDELPQLLNVLRGEMSLVGPRPHATVMDEYYESQIPNYFLRFSVRPGITGLAQIQGHRGPIRSLEGMQSRISADVSYVRMQSISLDLRILLATVPLALWRRNAS